MFRLLSPTATLTSNPAQENHSVNSNSNANTNNADEDIRSQRDALQLRYSQLQEKLNKAVGHLKPLVEENKSLKLKIESLSTINQKSELNNSDTEELLLAEIGALKQSLKVVQDEKENSLQSLHEKIKSLIQENNVLNTENMTLSSLLAIKDAEIAALRSSEADIQNQLANSLDKLKTTELELASVAPVQITQPKLQQSQEKVTELVAKLTQVTEANVVLTDKLALFQELQAGSKSQKKRTQIVLKKDLVQNNVKIADSQQENGSADHDEKILVQTLRDTCQTLENRVAQLSDNLIVAESTRTNLDNELHTERTEASNLRAEIVDRDLRTQSLQEVSDARVLAVEKRLDQANTLRDQLSIELESLKSNFEESENGAMQIRQLKFNTDSLVHEVERLLRRLVYELQRREFAAAGVENNFSLFKDVDSSVLSSLELREVFDLLKVEINEFVVAVKNEIVGYHANIVREQIEAVSAEYDQFMVDLNTELEEKTKTLHELQQQLVSVSKDKVQVSSENNVLMEKLRQLKTITPKIQEEMEANKNLKKQVDALNQQISNLTDEKALLKAQIIELNTAALAVAESSVTSAAAIAAQSEATATADEATSLALQEELLSLQVEYERLRTKLTALQHHMAESEDAFNQDLLKTQATVDEYKLQLDALERERETWEDMARESRETVVQAEEAAAEARAEAAEARNALDDAIRGRERDAISLGNLQSVLEEFQASKQADIDLAIDGISKQLAICAKSLEEYKQRAAAAEEKLNSVDLNAPSAVELETQLHERNIEIGKLRGRVISLETYLTEAIRRAESADSQVDRRLISNLLVQFLSIQRGDSKRFEVLTVIASVLKLSDEDRVKIGILRKIGGDSIRGPRSPGGGESFTDLWISFLIKEAGTAERAAQIKEANAASIAVSASGASAGSDNGGSMSLNGGETPSRVSEASTDGPPSQVRREMKRPLLVVLDLNGTLIDRVGKGIERAAANRNPLCPAAPDLTLNNHKVYLRPYLDVFLKFLFENFHVAAWTSATPKNSAPLADFIFEPFGGAKPLEFLWDREKCIIEPMPGKEYNSVKDLARIWSNNNLDRQQNLSAKSSRSSSPSPSSSSSLSTASPLSLSSGISQRAPSPDSLLSAANIEQSDDYPGPHSLWNQHNTILIDDSASKSCRTPLNHLLVPTFSVGNLSLAPNCDEDTVLLITMAYLESLLESHDRSIQSQLFSTRNNSSLIDNTRTQYQKQQNQWSVQKFMKESPLYLEIGSATYLNSKYCMMPSPEMRVLRHRYGANRPIMSEIRIAQTRACEIAAAAKTEVVKSKAEEKSNARAEDTRDDIVFSIVGGKKWERKKSRWNIIEKEEKEIEGEKKQKEERNEFEDANSEHLYKKVRKGRNNNPLSKEIEKGIQDL
ncbi:hypothetical protein HK100_005007 [Physocladia obscura]|uniref:FCP1 homology domain-containing protein n=1 Tax=Physocladia obscura TaxID=109957 RepID=A0AAD5T8K8_9FUNG|nr:hypothetical protein HK100_005007 [Physocladia obscura]